MAGSGIDYFPFSVDFFEDDKMALIEGEFGLKGTVIAVRLLCKIYKEGYYYQWGDDECLLFARKAGAGIVPNTVREVVGGLVKRSFFDKGVFDSFGILTSRGIQTRYFEAVKRRRQVDVREELLLVDVSKYSNVRILRQNVYIEGRNADISAQSKVKESKVAPPQTPPHVGVSSEKEEERSFGDSFFTVRNAATLRAAVMGMGGTADHFEELSRLSNGGDAESPLWGLLDAMRRQPGRITITDALRSMLEYERRGVIRCKSKRRVAAERMLPELVKPEETAAVLMALTCPEREERCLQAIAEVRNSNGRIRMPARFILNELQKVK